MRYTKKESRVFKVVVVVVVFFFRCVLGFVAHKVFSLSLSFLGDDKKKTLPLFAKVNRSRERETHSTR